MEQWDCDVGKGKAASEPAPAEKVDGGLRRDERCRRVASARVTVHSCLHYDGGKGIWRATRNA